MDIFENLTQYVNRILNKRGRKMSQFDEAVTETSREVSDRYDATGKDWLNGIELEEHIALLRYQSLRAMKNQDRRRRLLTMKPLSSDKTTQKLSKQKYGIQLGEL